MTVTWKSIMHRSGIFIALLLGACTGNNADFEVCDAPSETALSALPTSLSQAGLFSNMSSETLASGVWAFEPRFKLWSDGAAKRRWIFIPAGEKIDTSDMNQWRFPVGTKLFKEFTRSGVRVETRILTKTGLGDESWAGSAYIWNADQSDAVLSPEGGTNQLGTAHDVPSGAECSGCHGGRASHVLGFSAVQLAWEPPSGNVTIAELKAAGVLGQSVKEQITLPASSQDQAALGYLHANCSHCHNTTRPARVGSRCYDPQEDFDFSIPASGVARVQDSPAYLTGIREQILVPGNAGGSEMIQRLSRGNPRMPALGSEVIDQQGRALLTEWVNSL